MSNRILNITSDGTETAIDLARVLMIHRTETTMEITMENNVKLVSHEPRPGNAEAAYAEFMKAWRAWAEVQS